MQTLRRLVRVALTIVAVPMLVTTVFPQAGPQEPPRLINQSTDGQLKPFRFRSIGPASMGGRIDDIAVSESDPSIIYVGYAVGGVFKSDNNGTTFESGVRDLQQCVDRRHRDRSEEPEHCLRRHRRGEQPADLDVRRRDLQDDRRRQDLHQHRPEGHADDRAHRDRSEESRDGLRRVAGASVRTEPRARRLQDDRRRQDVEQDQVHRRRHGLHRHRDRSVDQQHPLRGELSAAPQRLLLQRRRAGERAVEDDGRRKDLDENDRRRTAAGNVWPHRARRLAVEPQGRVRAN